MHQVKYRGHTITVETRKIGTGWKASYQVGAGDIRDCDGRPLPNEKVVITEAVSEAKFAIDQMLE